MKRIFLMLTILGCALAVAACAPAPPDPAVLLKQAADNMAAADTLQFSISYEGGEDFILTLGNGREARVSSVAGYYQSPDKIAADAKLEQQNLTLTANILWVADKTYIQIPPFFPTYTPLIAENTPNVSTFFAAGKGIPAILTGEVKEPALVDQPDLEGIATYHLKGTVDGAMLQDKLKGLGMQDGADPIEIWIDKELMQVIQIILTEPDGRIWTLTFSDFGAPVEIPTP